MFTALKSEEILFQALFFVQKLHQLQTFLKFLPKFFAPLSQFGWKNFATFLINDFFAIIWSHTAKNFGLGVCLLKVV